MQFAGQRTDAQLKLIGEPDNILIKLSNDILPDPDAIMVTGITPQSALADGISEAEFLRYFTNEICMKDTIFVGYNNVRFDDEFIRHTLYRNFYDAYEWCWMDGRSRWDLLDVIRMTRALRPDGIVWPFSPDGKPSNRLELLTSMNGLDHAHAHDALSDVSATIVLARLLRNKQTKLFDYLLTMRDKNKVKELTTSGQPFVYTSGKYANAYEKTTVVVSLGEHPGKQGVLVYDLRRDPSFLKDMSPDAIAEAWHARTDDETMRFPIKTMQFNRCPAVAPLGVLDEGTRERLGLDLAVIQKHRALLGDDKTLRDRLLKALSQLDKLRQATFISDVQDVDERLYDGFFGDEDKRAMAVVRTADKHDIAAVDMEFKDPRLQALFPLYKARNFPGNLSSEERAEWEKYRYQKLVGGGAKSRLSAYFMRIAELMEQKSTDASKQYLLQELQLYGEAIMPMIEDEE